MRLFARCDFQEFTEYLRDLNNLDCVNKCAKVTIHEVPLFKSFALKRMSNDLRSSLNGGQFQR